MRFKKDESKTYDLSKLPGKPIEIPQTPVQKTWEPVNQTTFTMPYGGQVPKMVDVQAVNKENPEK